MRLEDFGEILEAKEEKVIMDRKDFDFFYASHLNAAGGYAEDGVLDRLKFME